MLSVIQEFYCNVLDEMRITASSSIELSESVKPLKYMQSAAERGLKIRDAQPDSNKCCTSTGLARANQLAKGENVSIDTVKRMKSFASRHASTTNWDDSESKGVQAMMLWGIPSASKVESFIKWCDSKLN